MIENWRENGKKKKRKQFLEEGQGAKAASEQNFFKKADFFL